MAITTDPKLLGLIFGGGVVGTAARASIEALFPSSGWPWATFAINLSGALVLGWLLETLARRGPDDGRRRQVRLCLGTGLLGSYTTYSTLVVEAMTVPVWLGFAYALASVVLGVTAAWLGGRLACLGGDR